MTAPVPRDPRAREHKIVMNWTDSTPEEIRDLADQTRAKDRCAVDGKEIKVMSFKGMGVCSELCRKLHAGEMSLLDYEKEKEDKRI